MICADGAVYAWGMNYWEENYQHAGNGNLGTENTTDDFVTAPTKVKIPAEALPIKQVDAGSGSHFVAMGCNGTVWCWGNNANHQAGNPAAGGVVTTPIQVKAGEVPSSLRQNRSVQYLLSSLLFSSFRYVVIPLFLSFRPFESFIFYSSSLRSPSPFGEGLGVRLGAGEGLSFANEWLALVPFSTTTEVLMVCPSQS